MNWAVQVKLIRSMDYSGNKIFPVWRDQVPLATWAAPAAPPEGAGAGAAGAP